MSPSKSSRSSRAPLPRWKRATGSTGRPVARLGRAGNKGRGRRHPGLRTASAVAGFREPGLGRAAEAARSSPQQPVGSGLSSRASQPAKPGAGESVTKLLRLGTRVHRSSTTCLIRKLPKETPCEPALAVRDRIEHRRRRGLEAGSGRAPSQDRGRSAPESRSSARPRRRSAARRRAPDGRRRSSAGRPARCGGADRPSREISCTAS